MTTHREWSVGVIDVNGRFVASQIRRFPNEKIAREKAVRYTNEHDGRIKYVVAWRDVTDWEVTEPKA